MPRPGRTRCQGTLTSPGPRLIHGPLYNFPGRGKTSTIGDVFRADYRLAPSQWEAALQSNAVSHWLGANLESALCNSTSVVMEGTATSVKVRNGSVLGHRWTQMTTEDVDSLFHFDIAVHMDVHLTCELMTSPNVIKVIQISQMTDSCVPAHFRKWFSIVIQVRWTFHSAATQVVMKWSLLSFARGTIVMLSGMCKTL